MVTECIQVILSNPRTSLVSEMVQVQRTTYEKVEAVSRVASFHYRRAASLRS